ncbi:MAG: RND transporter [Candidatus Rokuibacteriota bacterium]|nr:MAG: RND transporter [Candidatus Rokubacteria bacterium]
MVTAALLAGCAIGPNYKRPVVAEPQAFRGQATAEAVSLADLPWWEVFEDPVLRGLIEEALREGYDVRIAAARVEEARARFVIARAAAFPQVGYAAGYERRHVPESASDSTTSGDNFVVNVSVGWELDLWGRVRSGREAARRQHASAALDAEYARQSTYNVFQDRLQVGVASKLETSRAEGALGAAQASIPQLESDIVAKENQISILLGRSPLPIPRGLPMYAQAVVPTVPAGLPSALLERRPDLRQAEQQLVSANARIGVAKAEFFPKLSLTALFGTASPEVSALTGGSATIWAVAGMLSGPLLNAGRTLGNYRASVAQWEQAKLQYEQAVLTALREVSDALTALGKLSDAETGQEKSVKALGGGWSLTDDQWKDQAKGSGD